jgi:hypothetical protein
MVAYREGLISYHFPEDMTIVRLEANQFYGKRWQNFGVQLKEEGNKETDFIGIAADSECLWLIEVKDYRRNTRTKPSSLGLEFAKKCRDTLACLAGMRMSPWSDTEQRQLATKALRSKSIRCILHVEQVSRSKLFPLVIDPADLLDSVRRSVRSLDPHARAGDAEFLRSKGVPFSIELLPCVE